MDTASVNNVLASGVLQQSILQQGQLALQLLASIAPPSIDSASMAANSSPTVVGDNVGTALDVYA